MKYTVHVYNDTSRLTDWLYGEDELWKDRVGVFEFDETFVLKGNKRFKECIEASWYHMAAGILSGIDQGAGRMDYPDLTDAQWDEMAALYDSCRYIDTNETIVKALGILFPEKKFESRTIRGYSQSDWQEVIYPAAEVSDEQLERLEAYYFGKVSAVDCDPEDEDEVGITDTVTDDELWEAERNGTVADLIRDVCGLEDEDGLTIYKSDGYIRHIKWKKIS